MRLQSDVRDCMFNSVAQLDRPNQIDAGLSCSLAGVVSLRIVSIIASLLVGGLHPCG